MMIQNSHCLEKHISLDFDVPNAQDWKVSCGPENFSDFVKFVRQTERALGDGRKVRLSVEEENQQWACKSLVFRHPLDCGHLITQEDLVAKRPGWGIRPAKIGQVIGRRLQIQVREDDLVIWDNLD